MWIWRADRNEPVWVGPADPPRGIGTAPGLGGSGPGAPGKGKGGGGAGGGSAQSATLYEQPIEIEPVKWYDSFGFATKSGSNLVLIHRRGAAHSGGTDGLGIRWISQDDGLNWVGASFADSSAYDDRNFAGGVTSSGTIIAFYGRYDGFNWIDMQAARSTDAGLTWSTVTGIPENGMTSVFSPYGPMVELPSGRLLQTFYGEAGTTNKVWVSRSDDDGVTWTFHADIWSSTAEQNETAIVKTSGSTDANSVLLAITRTAVGGNAGVGLKQAKSTDGGATWTAMGTTNLAGGNRLVSPWLQMLPESGDVLLTYAARDSTAPYDLMISQADPDAVLADQTTWPAETSIYEAAATSVADFGYPSTLSLGPADEDTLVFFYDDDTEGSPNGFTRAVLGSGSAATDRHFKHVQHPFDDGPGSVVSDDLSNIPGSIQGSPTWNSEGLVFAGNVNDYVEIGTLADFDFVQNTGIFTILIVVQIDTWNADAAHGLVTNLATTNGEKGFALVYDNRGAVGSEQRLRLIIGKGKTTAPTAMLDAHVASAVGGTGYHLLGATGDGTNASMIVGSTLTSVGAFDGSSSGRATRLLNLARWQHSSPFAPLDGTIAYHRILKKHTTAAELTTIHSELSTLMSARGITLL